MKPSSILHLTLSLTTLLTAVADAADAEREFSLKVLPLLKAKCFACHGDDPKKIKGDLNLLNREGMLAGGENSSSVLVPGKASESDLFLSVTWEDPGLEMPPKENDRLTAEQVDLLRRWIDAGAPWPDEAAQKRHREEAWSVKETDEGVILKTSGGLADEWTYRRYQPEDVWAFRPVQKPQEGASIDAFIRAKLSEAGFDPAPEAEPRVLIRRATFDLIGLPPTPEEVETFLTAWEKDREKAWEGLIDRLLASPHYGERWAQHWFDVVRYADTGGMANDYERSNLWRYRDWVIEAFNDDMPYNQFVREQLAGDELADRSALERVGDGKKLAQVRSKGDYTDDEARQIVATGFLRLGPWDNAMITDEEARQIYLDDLVNAVGQTFLATTMRCFKCHDHKFDPLPTRDYYRMYASLAGTQMAERPLRFTEGENREGFDKNRAFVQRMLDFARGEKNQLVSRREEAAKQWYAEHNLPYKDNDARKDDPDEKKPPRNVGLDYVAEGQLKVREQDEWIWERTLERFEPMVQGVYDGPNPKLNFKSARKLRMPQVIDASWTPESFIYSGGSLSAPGERVQPGVLSALNLSVEGSRSDPFLISERVDQRRLDLANWIAHPDNPLTTRAIVNRVWQHHFGKPIAGNPNNFGAKGAKPTHPELLDFLADDFVKHGWTLKRLHKLIMLSDAYRMAARNSAADQLKEKDPNNDLLAFFPTRRLTAEEMRDAMLRITGELNPAPGGLPAFPEINLEVALQPRMIQFSLAPSYQPSLTPAERNRRSVYAYRVRGQADPFMEVFNKPGPNESCENRDAAAVSPQAFTLLNSEMMTDRSIAFALRVGKEETTPEAQIDRAFQLAFGRDASTEERERLVPYLRAMKDYHAGVQPKPVSYPTTITRSLVEEFSGKTFEYEEILPAFEHYTPDTKASDVDAETRALADVCLLLLNSHEFIYLN
ncbi:MAG: PSD1 domain-containing protein [Verrucomicrobiae bacterium]|nr:PSD1 domain-containing protein [Verrucomicrobiae bacterium]